MMISPAPAPDQPGPRRTRPSLCLVAAAGMLALAALPAAAETPTLHRGPGLLLEDRDGRIYAAVPGPAAVVIRGGDGNGWEVLAEGRLGGLQVTPDGDLWMALGNEVLRYPRAGGAPVSRTPSFRPEGEPGRLLATRWGDVWCTGCADVRLGDAMFQAAPLAPPGWEVTPVCDDPFGNVWAVAARGERLDLAVLTDRGPHAWQRLDLPAGVLAGPWWDAATDDAGFVWVAVDNSLVRADARSAGHRSFANPADSPITAIGRGGGQLLVGFADGSLRELVVNADDPPEWRDVLPAGEGPVQALLHAGSGGLWVLRAGRVQRFADLEKPWHEHWEELPFMPAGNHDNIFARIGDRLYTAGGKTFFGWPADEWVNLDHVWSYHVPSGTWRVEAPMLEPGKAYSGIAVLEDELWLLGGLFRHGEGDATRPTATVEIFDPATGRYRLGPPLPQKAGQVVALSTGGRLYGVGGSAEEGHLAQLLSIGPGESDWRVDAPPPGTVYQASGCVLDGRLYIAAGPKSQCPGLFVYDPGRDEWSEVDHPVKAPNAPLCTAFEDRVWVLGGQADGGRTESYAYDPASGEWTRGPDLPLKLSWAAAADADGRLLVAGGAFWDDRVNDVLNTDRVFLMRSAP